MLPTYPAVLRDGKLDWGVGGPPPLPFGAVPVHVTLLTSSGSTTGGQAMAAIAAAGGPSGFGDPADWQREVRAERPLPGREG